MDDDVEETADAEADDAADEPRRQRFGQRRRHALKAREASDDRSELEDRQVHRDHETPDHDPEEHDDDRLEEAR